MKNKDLSLYLHIPFCVKKCDYCDFLSFPCENGCQYDIDAYIDKLCLEIEASRKKYRGYNIYSVFIGGGTPSILSIEQMGKIMEKIKLFIDKDHQDNIEITLEVNPGTVTSKKALSWRELGINRVSMGLQSANNQELKLLGRIHTYEQFLESWDILTATGFTNRNIDIISGLPNQDISVYEKTLDEILRLEPEHISAYSLQLEEGTKFGETYTREDLPSDELDRDMYYLTKKKLEEHGYNRYEISNYSKPGFESRHNIVYWKRGNYLGIGLGASSLVENSRFTNTQNMLEYLKWDFEINAYESAPYELNKSEQMEEFIFLGLRLTEGIDLDEFEKKYDVSFYDLFSIKMESYIKSGHLILEDRRLRLTDKGIDVSNVILSDFLID